jgi:predicted TIM-barrel fold metal-dependent hydrolase
VFQDNASWVAVPRSSARECGVVDRYDTLLLRRSYSELMVIDIHVHAFPDKVATKAIESLEAVYGVKAFSDGTVAALLAHMAESGVDLSVIQAVSTAPRQVISINTWVSGLSQTSREPANDPDAGNRGAIMGFGTIHPKFEGYRDEIQRMKELGIKGVKLQPTFQEFYPDDERMFPVYEEIIKAGLIILFHAGDEIKPVPLIYSTPERLARVLDAMQSEIDNYNYRVHIENEPSGPVKVVAAHLGGYRMWDQVEQHLLGRDLYFDASYVFGRLEPARAARIIRSHGTDRILFGSDFPFAQQQKDIQTILKLDITQEEKEKILGKNASLLLGLS